MHLNKNVDPFIKKCISLEMNYQFNFDFKQIIKNAQFVTCYQLL